MTAPSARKMIVLLLVFAYIAEMIVCPWLQAEMTSHHRSSIWKPFKNILTVFGPMLQVSTEILYKKKNI